MKKIAVLYKSKYGFTETYARWFSEELEADLLKADHIDPGVLRGYDVILYGGGLYAGGVNGISLLTKNFESIRGKALFLFTVGAADVTNPKNIETIRKALFRVLTPEMREKIKIYHLRGGLDYPKMSFLHRTVMAMMVKALRKKPESELDCEQKTMLSTYGQKIDFTDRTAIFPLVDEVKTRIKSNRLGGC